MAPLPAPSACHPGLENAAGPVPMNASTAQAEQQVDGLAPGLPAVGQPDSQFQFVEPDIDQGDFFGLNAQPEAQTS
eukprot:8320536-Pyramimonas_sp.AAC.1